MSPIFALANRNGGWVVSSACAGLPERRLHGRDRLAELVCFLAGAAARRIHGLKLGQCGLGLGRVAELDVGYAQLLLGNDQLAVLADCFLIMFGGAP